MSRMLVPKDRLYDITYDRTTQDWAVVNGDFVLTSNIETIASQLIEDALESQWNSMRYTLPDWGNEGRNDSYLPPNFDLPIRNLRQLYLPEILTQALARLWTTIRAASFTFPVHNSDPDQWSAVIEGQMSDRAATEYSATVTWDAVTKRAEVI